MMELPNVSSDVKGIKDLGKGIFSGEVKIKISIRVCSRENGRSINGESQIL